MPRYTARNALSCLQDNATFLHIPFWSDDLTFINNVGLLLAPAVGDPAVLALTKPAAGRNYVLAADHATLVPLLQAAGSTSTSIPLLVYIATNVSLGRPEDTAVGLAINRPVYLVGRVTMPTSIDFGMAVNQLVLLGSFSRMTLAQLVLENLAPGDERSVDFAGSDVDVTMGYNMWPMLYPRCAAAQLREVHGTAGAAACAAAAALGSRNCSNEMQKTAARVHACVLTAYTAVA